MSILIRDDLPCGIVEIENVFIPMSDGCLLAARLWLPADSDKTPVPAVFEYIPYRKRDFMRARDEPMHRYMAGHGYAAVRVDLRGSGDSGGVLHDEYLPQEQQDALEVIDWLTAQPWCDGNVGMTGISWGGFNALQVAALRPPALKAIITLCASDDRYADDAHYMGGCLLNENQIWGSALFALNALPPDPDIVGDRWRDMWHARLDHDRPFPAVWLEHQRRDDYWRQGSVAEDFSRISCAVYAIGGWADGYSNAVPRLLAGLSSPRKGLIGPWAHTFPHNGVPGPAIGYLQEALRWWDHWLKGRPTGIMEEPALRAWMQYSTPPVPLHPERDGHWVAESSWPSPNISAKRWHAAGAGALAPAPAPAERVALQSPQTTGSNAGDWCGFGAVGEAPMDQRADDGRSVVFDSPELTDTVDILGAPLVGLRISADRPAAMVAVRLNEVAPDGTSALVTYGLLNLAHRNDHARPEPLEPGEFYDVSIALNDVGHRFPAGHQLRLAVSSAYWPVAWPAAETVALTLDTGGCWVDMPVRAARAEDRALAPFAAPEAAAGATRHTALRPAEFIRSFERDLTTNETTYRLLSDGGDLDSGAVIHVDGANIDLGHFVERRFTIGDHDPASARAAITERIMMRRDDWLIRVEASTTLRADREHFYLEAELRAREGDTQVFERFWKERIRRDGL